jgi:hypothetical protein
MRNQSKVWTVVGAIVLVGLETIATIAPPRKSGGTLVVQRCGI